MDTICFKGFGSNESGNHTKQEFLNIMKLSKKACPRWFRAKKCAVCKQMTKENNHSLKNPKVYSEEEKKHYRMLANQCLKCSQTKKKCSLKQYMKYGNATFGKCKTRK